MQNRIPSPAAWPHTELPEGVLHRAAVASLREIAGVLIRDDAGSQIPSVAVGTAGHALFLGYASRCNLFAGDRDRLEEAMLGQLQAAVDGLGAITGHPFLFEGFTGVAWAVHHLRAGGFMEDGEDLCLAVDEAVLGWLDSHAAAMNCELIGGLAGLGLYGLGRVHCATGRQIVDRVVAALDASAVEHQGYRTWFNPADEYSDAAERMAGGSYNLGLSHGVPGAVVFLAKAVASGVPQAAALAASAGDWLLGQRRSYGNGSCFPTRLIGDPAEEADGSRLAWCYGDLGISAALMVAAAALGRTDWRAAALGIAGAAAMRGRSGVVDGGLCHGAFGIAHIFHRLFRATGEDVFWQAAQRWLTEGLALRRPGEGLAGFLAWLPGRPEAPAEVPWQPESGYLEGIAGIGLVLLGFLSGQEPLWDELLMVDIPPPSPER